MSSAKGIREVGWFDCAGGGQIVVEKGIAYVGHMASPHGTSIVDVRDPKNPKALAELDDARRARIPTRCECRTASWWSIMRSCGEPPAGLARRVRRLRRQRSVEAA